LFLDLKQKNENTSGLSILLVSVVSGNKFGKMEVTFSIDGVV